MSINSPNLAEVNLSNTPVIKTKNLSKIYNSTQSSTIALHNATLSFYRGTFTAIMGPSGSGKSTFLHLIAGLDTPSEQPEQELIVEGQSLLGQSENWLAKFRAMNVGFILQFFGLLPTLTVLENVMMAGYFSGMTGKDRKEKATAVIKQVGLEERMNYYPNQLSGGQMQRVAIARALINEPHVLFADEPTGNLDTRSGEEILLLLRKMVDEKNITLVLVTHDPKIKEYADRIVQIVDGKIVQDSINSRIRVKN